MSILSAIWNLIKKIFSAVIGWIKKILSKYFWIILILAIIWFAPVITAWLVEVGAPQFLVTAFQGISELTPSLQGAGKWLWDAGSSVAKGAWTSYKGLDTGTQAAIALGAAAAIAPEETSALLDETAATASSLLGTIGTAISKTSAFGLLLVGGAIYLLSKRKKDDTANVNQPAQAGAEEVNYGKAY